MVIGHAAGTEIHKMGSPLGGEAGEFYQSFGGMGNGTESCAQLVPPPLRSAGGDGQCHGAGAGDCRWSLGGMVNSTGG